MKPSSLPRSAGLVRSASCAVAATNEMFQPSPSPSSRTAVAKTLETQSSPIVDSAITTSPTSSAGVRPTRSISAPITRTSAYIPKTCAPMIGKTESWLWWWCSTTT